MPLPLKAKDRATGNLLAGIGASDLSIPLESGDGANFPQPYTGAATSGGDADTLNCTGIGAMGLTVGDHIHNVTDNSWATIEVIATDSITTSKLKGGSDNTWQNADVWRVNEMVLTIATINSEGNDTAYEEILVSNRSTDTFTVPAGGRGYNGTVAQTWLAGAYVQLRIVAPYFEELKAIVRQVNKCVDTNTDAISTTNSNVTTANTNIANLQQGLPQYVVATGSSNAYAISPTPALGAYTAGNEFAFKANFDNTGSATLNVSGLGAKTIKKLDGATNLSSGDIKNGQVVLVRYDGTNMQMLSPVAAAPSTTVTRKTVKVVYSTSSNAGASSTSRAYFDNFLYVVPSGDIVAGTVYEFDVGGAVTWVTGTFAIGLDLDRSANNQHKATLTPAGSGKWRFSGYIVGTAAAGAAASIRIVATLETTSGSGANAKAEIIVDATTFPTNTDLDLEFYVQYGSNNGGHASTLNAGKLAKESETAFS